MSSLDEQNPWVVRTDFSSDQIWEVIKTEIAKPQKEPLSGLEFTANVRFIEQAELAKSSAASVVRALPNDYPGFVVFVADDTTMGSEEHSLWVVGFAPQNDAPEDAQCKPCQISPAEIKSFRALPSTIQSIENNLSLANMDFEDFANSVDPDGVFRGFPG